MELDQTIERSFRTLLKVRGKRVVYRRSEQTTDLDVVVGSTPFRLGDAYGAGSMRVVSRDWLVLRSALLFNGEPFEPERGDRIIETVKGVDRVWEIGAPMGSDEPASRDSDPGGVVVRIHSKEVSE